MRNDPGSFKKGFLGVAGRRWQAIVMVAVLCLGVAASVALFVMLSNREQGQIRRDLEELGHERLVALKRTLELDFSELKAVSAFITGTDKVERHEFVGFVSPLLKDRPNLQSIQWAPQVPYADRAKFEEAVARDGFPGFRIRPYDRQSLPTPSSSSLRDECYPLLYAVPTDGDVPALGADLASNPVCLEAMNRARDTTQIATTSKIQLSSKSGDQVGVRVFLPVYQKNREFGTVEERRKHLEGFVVGVLRIEDALEESLSPLTPAGIDIRVLDTSDRPRQTLLAWHRSRLSESKDAKAALLRPSSMSYSETVDVGGRQWTGVCVALPRFIAERKTWYPLGVSLISLLLTGLLTAYLIAIAAYTGRTARLATELRQANQLLGNEVADRKRMESNLRASQTKYRTLCDSSSDAIMLITPEGTHLAGNRASLALYGCKDELELTSKTPALLSPEYQPDGELSATKAREMIAIAMEKGSHSFEWTHKRVDDGKEFFANVTLAKFELDDRCFLQATVRDITEQKRAEASLWTTELKYKTLYESSRDAISLMTRDGALLSANPANVAMFGCKDELDFLSHALPDLSPEHQPDGISSEEKAREMWALALKKGSHCYEWTHRRIDDGSEFLANVTLTRMDFEDSPLLLATVRDITEQRRAEELLRASETKYRTLFDASSDAIMLRTPDRRVVAANRAAVELFGCTDESELRSLNPADIYADYQPDGMLSADKAPLMAEAALREGAYSFEWKYKRRDDTEFLANVLWTRMELEGQTILLTTIRDITEQRRAEESRRASETKYKALFEGAGDAIMLRKPDMTVLAANAATLALFHAKDVDEVSVGMPLVFSPEYQPDGTRSVDKMKQMAATVMRDGVNRFEWQYRRKDGSEFLANVLLTRIQLTDECVVQVTIRDITEQRRLEESLRDSEAEYRTLYDASSDAIMYAAPETGMIAGNPATIRLFGCRDEAEFVTLGPADLSPEYQPDGSLSSVKAQEMMAIAMERGSNLFEWKHRRMDGSEFFAAVLLTRIEMKGRLLVLSTVRDITQQKEMEEALKASERRFSDVLHASRDAMLLLDGDRFVDCNEAAAKMLDYSTVEECLLTHPGNLSPPTQPDGRSSHEKAVEMIETAKREGFHRFEWMHRKANGEDLPVEVSLTAIVVQGKNQLLSHWRDISVQKRTEEALRVSERRHRLFAENVTDTIWTMDLDSRFTYLSPSVESLMGYKWEEGMQLTAADVVAPSSLALAQESLQGIVVAAQRGERLKSSKEYEVLRADGSTVWAEVSAGGLYDEAGQLVGFVGITRDITERRRLEAMLRASERRHRLFAENVSEVIWTMDLSGRFTYVSPSAEQLWGAKWDQSQNLMMADVLTPSSLAIGQNNLERIAIAAQSGQRLMLSAELELLRIDGSTVWTETSTAGLYDEAGRFSGFLGIIHDITERRQLEQQRARSLKRLEGVNRLEEELLLRGPIEKKFKKITETAVDLLDLDFCRIWIIKPSDRCEEGCGHAGSPEDAPSCDCRDKCLHLMASAGRYTHIDGGHSRVPLGFYKVGRIASGDSNKLLTNDVTTDPEVADHEWAKSLGLVSFAGYKLRDAEGNAVGVLAMFAKHPISEEDDAFIANLAEMTSRVIIDEKAADAIEKENAKLSAMISGMEEGIVFADANNVIIEINDYLCRFVGRDRNDIVGKRIEDFHQGKILDGLLAKIEHFRQTPGAGPFVLQRALGDSEVILRVQPIYRGGRYDGVLLNVVDVSELVKARRDAELANQAKSRFLANMSHEIRTPMTAILGYADLLMDPRINASNRNNYSAIIHRSGEHLLTLINDILDLSKIESGKFLLEMKQCNLVSLLADVASLMRPRAESRGVSFLIEYAGELPETVLTDGARLRQAIINLVGNAIKFTERGSVRVVTTFLPDWRSDQPAVKIEVIDTGIGIRPEVLPDLFQPFNQGDSRIAQRFGGTGLGLAISRHIVQMLGGDLNLTSVWGQGSTFVLTIPTGDLSGIRMLQNPVEAEQEASAQIWRSTTKDLQGVHILLAEDGFDNRELIRTVLRTAGAEVETAENGRIALEKAEIGVFDVILMDMNMPEMDGYEATRNLRDRGYIKPILALTANAMAGDSAQCVAAGCNEHLAKPINRTHLIRTIARYVSREGADDREIAGPVQDASSRDEGIIVSEFIDDPDMVEIIAGFVGRLGAQFLTMGQAFADGQYDDLRRLAHMLKGAGGSYGYPSLTDACKALEDAAKAHDYTAADAALDMVGAMIRAIENGFPLHVSTKDTR